MCARTILWGGDPKIEAKVCNERDARHSLMIERRARSCQTITYSLTEYYL